MKTRVITAVVALIIFVPLLVIGGMPLLILTLAMAVVAMSEILRMKHRFFVSAEALLSFVGVIVITLPKSTWQDMPFNINGSVIFYIIVFLLLLHTVLCLNLFYFDDAGTLALTIVYVGTGFHYFFQADS